MNLGNKVNSKISAMGNKLNAPLTLGNKILNTKPNGVVSYPNSAKQMHQTLVNNIGNSSHSAYIPTGINLKHAMNKKSGLEKK
jgi:hypothetical protein